MKMKYLKDKHGDVDKNYMIAKDGSYIRDKKTGDKLAGVHLNQGYRVISITINNKNHNQIKICILQWIAWNGPIPKGHEIHHAGIDKYNEFDKINDHIYCLKCLTKSKHRSIHTFGKMNPNFGKGLKGSKNPMYGMTGKLAPMYGMSGEKCPTSILTNKIIQNVKYLRFIKNATYKEIAKKHNVSSECILRAIKGRTWNPNSLTKEKIKEKFIIFTNEFQI